jgi:BON domain
MKYGRTSRVSLLVQVMVVGLSLAAWSAPAFGQGGGGGGAGGGGGGAGGGGAGGGGAGGGGAGGGGTGTGGGGGSIGSGSLIFGNIGLGSSGVTNPSGTSPISSVNFQQPYMASPLTSGFGSNMSLKSQNTLALAAATGSANTVVTGKGTFGVTEYKVTTTNPVLNNNIRATAAAASAGTISTSAAVGFTTAGTPRAPKFVTNISPRMMVPAMPPAQIQASLNTVLAQSASALPTGRNLNVAVGDQNVVVLRGTVATEDERRFAEGLIRLTPGVQYVDNQIQIQQ